MASCRSFSAVFMVGVCISFATELKGISHAHGVLESGSGYDRLAEAEDFLEMSGDFAPTSLCRRQEIEASVKNHPDTFVAKCNEEGEFEAEQCHQDQCWCITHYGLEIAGTRHSSSIPFNCLDVIGKSTLISLGITETKYLSIYVSNVKTTTLPPFISNSKSDDVTIDETRGTTHHRNRINQLPFENNVEISVADPNIREIETNMLERKATSSPSKIPIYNRPGLLAGIIGGTSLGLLCVVLFVMFLVYRMRKKDEGSYALDEPKASPSSGVGKPHDREFFA